MYLRLIAAPLTFRVFLLVVVVVEDFRGVEEILFHFIRDVSKLVPLHKVVEELSLLIAIQPRHCLFVVVFARGKYIAILLWKCLGKGFFVYIINAEVGMDV